MPLPITTKRAFAAFLPILPILQRKKAQPATNADDAFAVSHTDNRRDCLKFYYSKECANCWLFINRGLRNSLILACYVMVRSTVQPAPLW